MSITFTANVADFARSFTEEPCLCAQMSGRFGDAVHGDLSEAVRADLQANAWKHCSSCAGVGVEYVPTSNRPELNLANDHALRLLVALGFECGHIGEVPLPEARRGVLRALNTDVSRLAQIEVIAYGAPRKREDGTVELRSVLAVFPALSEDTIISHILRFSTLVEEAAERGATAIRWE